MDITLNKLLALLGDPKRTSYPQDKLDYLIVKFIEQLLIYTATHGYSDIHIEPLSAALRIRLRKDGLLKPFANLPLYLHTQVVARVKVLANIDSTETRTPQDGSILSASKGAAFYRISTCPSIHGEKIAIRVVDDCKQAFALEQLGMTKQQQHTLKEAVKSSQGLILITGPTGSGKTNTIYTALSMLDHSTLNIITLEDPVEKKLEGVTQIALGKNSPLSFSKALRTLLRHDPDVIMVGEIRDSETAQAAFEAAMTGHLVLASLHTNDCLKTIERLRQMSIAPYQIGACLTLVISQRLISIPCQACQDVPSQDCNDCHQGFIGRQGIFELLTISNEMKSTIISMGQPQLLAEQAKDAGFQNFLAIASELANNTGMDIDHIKQSFQ